MYYRRCDKFLYEFPENPNEYHENFIYNDLENNIQYLWGI